MALTSTSSAHGSTATPVEAPNKKPVAPNIKDYGRPQKAPALVSRQQEMLASQARVIVYTEQVISNRTLQDTYVREAIKAGREKPSEVVFLNRENLEDYVRSEYRVFLGYVAHCVDNMNSVYHHSNPFIQEQYDSVTLSNGKKYLSQSMQMLVVHEHEGKESELKKWNLATGCVMCP